MILVRIILALALLSALIFAGARIYRRLPADVHERSWTQTASKGSWRIVVKNTITNSTLHSPIELYQFDLVAARREFESSPQAAKRFDDFLLRRMHDIAPVRADIDKTGQATASLTAGHWWLHAFSSVDTGETIEWRLPVDVAEHDQTIELSFDNAYEKTKRF